MRKIDRFDRYMKRFGLNDNRVTKDLGLSVGVMGKSRKPNRDLSDRVIEQILNYYNDIDRVWLLTGEGNMLKNTTSIEGNSNRNSGNITNNTINNYSRNCEDANIKRKTSGNDRFRKEPQHKEQKIDKEKYYALLEEITELYKENKELRMEVYKLRSSQSKPYSDSSLIAGDGKMKNKNNQKR